VGNARFFELGCAPAICRSPGLPDRCSAQRVLAGRQAPSGIPLADPPAALAPGRVHALGRFAADVVRSALVSTLPLALHKSLRTEFEWYACRGAFFHNDAHYGAVLFGAWCVAGPPRVLAFARAGLRVRAAPGDWVVFDPFEPHAVLDPGAQRYERARYEDSPASVFIGFELELDQATRATFGIGTAPAGGPVLASNVAVNAETGALG
jgi:hypothetical protein